VLLLENEKVIQAFAPHASQEAFTDGIRAWRSVRGAQHFDTTGSCHGCAHATRMFGRYPGSGMWVLAQRVLLPAAVAPPRDPWESASHSHA
jgi:hypothetical protein